MPNSHVLPATPDDGEYFRVAPGGHAHQSSATNVNRWKRRCRGRVSVSFAAGSMRCRAAQIGAEKHSTQRRDKNNADQNRLPGFALGPYSAGMKCMPGRVRYEFSSMMSLPATPRSPKPRRQLHVGVPEVAHALPTRTFPTVSISLPSINAGCGGIDVYLGVLFS